MRSESCHWCLAILLAGLPYCMRVTSLSIGIYDYVQNDTLALLDLSEGDLQFSSIYVQENDRTQQYAALENLYTVTGGQFWSALYHTDGAEDLLALAAASSTTGVHFLQFSKFVQLVTFKVPWFTSGYSYCHWWGITCCLTSTVLVLPQCTEGFQSVGQLTLPGANLTGKIPSDLLSALPDLSIVSLENNPGLTGTFDNVPSRSAADLLFLHLTGTTLQYACASPGAHGKTASYNDSCFPSFLSPDNTSYSVPAGKPGMYCPGLQFSANQSGVAGVMAEPLLYSYDGCICVPGLYAHYYVDEAGLFQMTCASPASESYWTWLTPILAVVLVGLAFTGLLLAYRSRVKNDWDAFRINALKRRYAPGTMMGRTGKGMEMFQTDMSLVMTDVEGSTALWEWNSLVMNVALELHDQTLRSLLPKFFGYEVTTEGDAFIVAFHSPMDAVSWALHVQLALLQVAWPHELLQHPLAKQESGSDNKLLFRGLRVRMAINTGVPVEIIVHNVTKQVEYRGEIVELTESLSHLPSGGQVLLSHTTYHGICQRLHDIKLPALSLKGPRHVESNASADLARQATISSVTSVTGLLPSGWAHTPPSSPRAARAHTASFSWLQLRRGASVAAPAVNAGLPVPHQLSTDAISVTELDIQGPPTPRRPSARLQQFSFTSASCAIIDMGSYVLSECRNRPYTAEDAAQPAIPGEHVVQILPQTLLERANLFPSIDSVRQVAPSYFNAPGVQAASVHPDAIRHLSSPRDRTQVAFAVVSQSGDQEWLQVDKQIAMIALGRFKSCVRSTLLLCDGYECCEKEGTFTAAFHSPRAALEWALTLQLALLRLAWGEELLSMPPTAEEYSPTTSQVLFRGLSARLGIASGLVLQPRPNIQTGRAEYAGPALDQASSLWIACSPGQILVEQTLLDAIRLEWARVNVDPSMPAQSFRHIALRNYALLVHRLESEVAASQLRASTSSLSGIVGRELSQSTKRTSTMPKYMQNFARNLALDISTSPDVVLENEADAQVAAPPRRLHSLRSTRRSVDGIAALPTWDAQMAAKAMYLGESGDGGRQEAAACQHIPCTTVGVEVYMTSQVSSRIFQDKQGVCQVFPARLSERRSTYSAPNTHGNSKVFTMSPDSQLVLSAEVMLPNVVHLPLAAEPPLYRNVLGTELADIVSTVPSGVQLI